LTLSANARAKLEYEDDYISAPKTGGYRSHHLIMGFRGSGKKKSTTGDELKFRFERGCSTLGPRPLKQSGCFVAKISKEITAMKNGFDYFS